MFLRVTNRRLVAPRTKTMCPTRTSVRSFLRVAGKNKIRRLDWRYKDEENMYMQGEYEGDYNEEEQRHGKGYMKWEDGSCYVGSWFEDSMTGSGILRWPSGSVYTGEFLEGLRVGKGTFVDAKGNRYQGMWEHDFMHGPDAIFTKPNGEIYRGPYADGVMEGEATYEYPTGRIIHGLWDDGKLVKTRYITFANGKKVKWSEYLKEKKQYDDAPEVSEDEPGQWKKHFFRQLNGVYRARLIDVYPKYMRSAESNRQRKPSKNERILSAMHKETVNRHSDELWSFYKKPEDVGPNEGPQASMDGVPPGMPEGPNSRPGMPEDLPDGMPRMSADTPVTQEMQMKLLETLGDPEKVKQLQGMLIDSVPELKGKI